MGDSTAFRDCRSLTSITVDSKNPAYTSVDGVLFDKTIQTIIGYPAGKNAETYVIPSSVRSIEYGAFWNCYHLTSIIIPSSVTSIEVSAFAGCNNLTSVTIPSSVISIGRLAFQGCNSLTSVTLSRRTQVNSSAFPSTASLSYSD
jgi:hypothetical protein